MCAILWGSVNQAPTRTPTTGQDRKEKDMKKVCERPLNRVARIPICPNLGDRRGRPGNPMPLVTETAALNRAGQDTGADECQPRFVAGARYYHDVVDINNLGRNAPPRRCMKASHCRNRRAAVHATFSRLAKGLTLLRGQSVKCIIQKALCGVDITSHAC